MRPQTLKKRFMVGGIPLIPSPQDERTPNSNTSKSKVPLSRLRQNYSIATLSAETNSLRKKVRQPPPHLTDNGSEVNGVQYRNGNSYYSEIEMSDSAGSTEFSSSCIEAKMVMPSQGEVILKKAALLILHLGLLLGLLPRRVLMFLVPLHFNGSQEMKQELDGTVASRKCSAPISAPLDASNVREDAFSDGNMHVKGGNTEPEECISGQGPWHAVIAYDAWVLLCLHSWARGLMEAPTFLENECALLRSAFSLQHIPLAVRGRTIRKKSSNNVHEPSTAKPKKTTGKMKVQVRKVKMSPDMPTGCSFSSFNPPRVSLDSCRARLSCLQTGISSGW